MDKLGGFAEPYSSQFVQPRPVGGGNGDRKKMMRSESGRVEPRKLQRSNVLAEFGAVRRNQADIGRGTAQTTNDGEKGGMREGRGRLDSLKVWR